MIQGCHLGHGTRKLRHDFANCGCSLEAWAAVVKRLGAKIGVDKFQFAFRIGYALAIAKPSTLAKTVHDPRMP